MSPKRPNHGAAVANLVRLGLMVLLFVGCRPALSRPEIHGVVLVVVDTLRADHLGSYGYSRPTTPGLDRWALRSARFEQALAPSSWTLPSFGSILTGRYPSGHGAGTERLGRKRNRPRFSKLDPGVASLPEILQQRNFATAAMITNTFLGPRFGLHRGFMTYDQVHNRHIVSRRSDTMLEKALAWIDDNRPRPFFLMVQLLDPHMPYDPPPSVRGQFTADSVSELHLPFKLRFGRITKIRNGEWSLSPEDQAFITAAYDEELLFVERNLVHFLDQIEKRGLLEDTVVMVTADHGEELFDHGSFEHGHTLYQELLRVPLLLWGPGVKEGPYAQPVSLIDLMPTVLDALGVEIPLGVDGQSLWPRVLGVDGRVERPLLAESTLYGAPRQALVDWPLKVVINRETGQAELFNLDSDPGERRDLGPEQPALVKRLLGKLDESLAAASRTRAQGVDLDQGTRQELRSLGYVE